MVSDVGLNSSESVAVMECLNRTFAEWMLPHLKHE